jgi:signal transduction histidine kinase
MVLRPVFILFILLCTQVAMPQAIDITNLPDDEEFLYFNGRTEYIQSNRMYSLDSLHILFLNGMGKPSPAEEVVYDNFNMDFYGYRFLVTNSDTLEREAVFLFGGRAVRHADIGQYGGGRWKYLSHTGYGVPFENRPYPFVRYGFSIKVPPGQTDTIYLSVDETYAFRVLGFMMFRPELLIAWTNSYYISIGWIIGLLSIFSLINFYLYFSLGEKINLWYGIYLVFALAFLIKFEGLEAEFLGLDTEWGFRLTPMTLFSNFGLAFLVKTYVAFLPDNPFWKHWKKIGNIIFHSIWIFSCILFIGFATKIFALFPRLAYPILLFCSITGIGYLICISMVSTYKRVTGAWLFALGISVVLIGASLRVLLLDGNFDIKPPFLFEKGLAIEAIVVSFALMYRYRIFREERNRLQMELKAKELESTRRLVETLEAEQERVARDLHDELSGNLAALQVLIHAGSLPQKEKANIEEVLSNAAQSARQIAHNLMPPALEHTGLKELLSSYFNQLLQKSHLQFHFFYAPDTPELPQRKALMVYRMLLELVNNILRHSQATEASVQINASEGQFHLVVEDNGTGIPASSIPGLGIRNLRTRVTFLGGNMEVDSSGKGSTIIISFPLDKNEIDNEKNDHHTGR